MIKFAPLAALATVATLAVVPTTVFAETVQAAGEGAGEATAPLKLATGKMIYASNGNRIAPIYRVNTDGNPQVILNSRLVTVPASSLSDVGGKVTTSLTKKEIAAAAR